mmetsp:Transcript_147282/g.274379  ORF Transcript_147282/g.274379 Transcript_147282/m.274379 type:complete len:194 (-) Transcript_147282:77-658(-)
MPRGAVGFALQGWAATADDCSEQPPHGKFLEHGHHDLVPSVSLAVPARPTRSSPTITRTAFDDAGETNASAEFLGPPASGMLNVRHAAKVLGRSALASSWFDSLPRDSLHKLQTDTGIRTAFHGHGHAVAASGAEALAAAKASLGVCLTALLASSAAWLSAYVNYSLEKLEMEHEEHEAREVVEEAGGHLDER